MASYLGQLKNIRRMKAHIFTFQCKYNVLLKLVNTFTFYSVILKLNNIWLFEFHNIVIQHDAF